MFSRNETRKFAVYPNNPNTNWDKFLRNTSSIEIGFKALTDISPDKKTLRKRAQDTNTQTNYIEFISTSSGTVFIEESPCKKTVTSENRVSSDVQFNDVPSLSELRQTRPELFKKLREEHFFFKITPEDVQARIGIKRPVSQRQVMGRSAEQIFEAYGAIINQETSQKLHLAHRQGWSLGGSQTKENLDPATAGSNYSTLLTIESPLKHLLKDGDIQAMNVAGTVIYHPLINLPMEIMYELSWGNARTAKISIYPLEHRKPTFSEKIVADAMFMAVRSPEITKPLSTIHSYSKSCIKTLFARVEDEALDHPSSITSPCNIP